MHQKQKQKIEEVKFEKLWEKRDLIRLLLLIIPVTVIMTLLIYKFLEIL